MQNPWQASPALDLALMIDTTGSMGTHIHEIRRQLLEVVAELREHFSDLRCSVIAFKDHDASYTTKVLTPTRSLSRVMSFLCSPELEVGLGGGGAEAVECALREANQLHWREGARRVGILIGDKPPHGGGLDSFSECPCHVDYRDEIEELAAQDVSLYPVRVGQCLEAQRIFDYFAARTGGVFLDELHVRDLPSSITSVCHREAGDLASYRRRLKASGRLTSGRASLLHSLAA
jgi:von Willebrand factor type A domain-containing protein